MMREMTDEQEARNDFLRAIQSSPTPNNMDTDMQEMMQQQQTSVVRLLFILFAIGVLVLGGSTSHHQRKTQELEEEPQKSNITPFQLTADQSALMNINDPLYSQINISTKNQHITRDLIIFYNEPPTSGIVPINKSFDDLFSKHKNRVFQKFMYEKSTLKMAWSENVGLIQVYQGVHGYENLKESEKLFQRAVSEQSGEWTLNVVEADVYFFVIWAPRKHSNSKKASVTFTGEIATYSYPINLSGANHKCTLTSLTPCQFAVNTVRQTYILIYSPTVNTFEDLGSSRQAKLYDLEFNFSDSTTSGSLERIAKLREKFKKISLLLVICFGVIVIVILILLLRSCKHRREAHLRYFGNPSAANVESSNIPTSNRMLLEMLFGMELQNLSGANATTEPAEPIWVSDPLPTYTAKAEDDVAEEAEEEDEDVHEGVIVRNGDYTGVGDGTNGLEGEVRPFVLDDDEFDDVEVADERL